MKNHYTTVFISLSITMICSQLRNVNLFIFHFDWRTWQKIISIIYFNHSTWVLKKNATITMPYPYQVKNYFPDFQKLFTIFQIQLNVIFNAMQLATLTAWICIVARWARKKHTLQNIINITEFSDTPSFVIMYQMINFFSHS